MENIKSKTLSKKILSWLLYAFLFFLAYLIIIQPLLSAMFEKDISSSETVLVKVDKKDVGNFNLGLMSKYKFKYNVTVIRRDGWIGYISEIYSNKDLKQGLKYGLEIVPVECNSWFEYFLIPPIWSHYSFDIADVYNNKKELKNLNFEKDSDEKLFNAIEENYSFFNTNVGD